MSAVTSPPNKNFQSGRAKISILSCHWRRAVHKRNPISGIEDASISLKSLTNYADFASAKLELRKISLGSCFHRSPQDGSIDPP
jgi:hypothetical protein